MAFSCFWYIPADHFDVAFGGDGKDPVLLLDRTCGQIHDTAEECREHLRSLRRPLDVAGLERQYVIAHADGSPLTVAEIDAGLSPGARATMEGLARAFNNGSPDGRSH